MKGFVFLISPFNVDSKFVIANYLRKTQSHLYYIIIIIIIIITLIYHYCYYYLSKWLILYFDIPFKEYFTF